METEVKERRIDRLHLLPFSGESIKKCRLITHRFTPYDYYVTFDYGVVAFNRSRGIWLKPRLHRDTHGYYRLRVGGDFNGRKAEYFTEHVEVAMAFVPVRNVFCTHVHHLDMDIYNKVADNLIHLTPYEHRHIHHEARRGEYTTMMQVLEEEREFCRENGIRFERKIDINLLTTKIKKYYESRTRTDSHSK